MTSDFRCDDCGRTYDTEHGRQIHQGFSTNNCEPTDPWKDEDTLRRLYDDEGMTTYEIADKFGVGASVIRGVLIDEEIPRRRGGVRGNPYATYYINSNGYPLWQNRHSGEIQRVSVHTVLACVDNDPHDVFADETRVHHGNDGHGWIPPVEERWANWRGNLQIMTQSEHTRHHKPDTPDWMEVMRIRELYRNGYVSQDGLAEMFGTSQGTVSRIIRGQGAFDHDEMKVQE